MTIVGGETELGPLADLIQFIVVGQHLIRLSGLNIGNERAAGRMRDGGGRRPGMERLAWYLPVVTAARLLNIVPLRALACLSDVRSPQSPPGIGRGQATEDA